MNEYIIKKWNSAVKEDDIVYHLGDVGFGTTEMLKELIGRLNGKKIKNLLHITFNYLHIKYKNICRKLLTICI